MTQEKQQDKIQWIMGFVHEYAKSYHYRMSARVAAYDDADQKRDLLESKLRELVREPLSDRRIGELLNKCDEGQDDTEFALSFARAIERAHNITNTSN